MENLYDVNGLIFWDESDIQLRRLFETYFKQRLQNALCKQNAAFTFIQCEAPLLTPVNLINKNYTAEDVYVVGTDNPDVSLVLRPETTMGSYLYAQKMLSGYNNVKYRPPVVVWQHGKSFRREQDQPTKFMRLKEFYQLEFQIIFSPSTANDYSLQLYPAVRGMLSDMIGPCRLEESDRLPEYSEQTMDVICSRTNMEVCSISKRKDLAGYKVIEVAIGTDRCIYNFKKKNTPTGEELAAVLHSIHQHGQDEKIVYPEETLLPALKAFGLPEPEWKESYALDEYQRRKDT